MKKYRRRRNGEILTMWPTVKLAKRSKSKVGPHKVISIDQSKPIERSFSSKDQQRKNTMAIVSTSNECSSDTKKPRINLDGDKKTGAYQRHQSAHRNFVGSDQHPVEAGRYHLHVSLACPWAGKLAESLFVVQFLFRNTLVWHCLTSHHF
jgi:hypothetical protein